MPPPPINRTLCKLNPFLRLLSNLGCSGKEAAAIWRLVEGASPTFCGYGEISLGALLDPKRDKALWDRKEALFFAFRNCEDASGVTHIPHHHDEIEDDGIDIDIDIDDEYDENDADGGGLTRSQAVERLHSYAVDDFFARLFDFCTLTQKDKLLAFTFTQLQATMDPGMLVRLGEEIVHKEALVAMVARLHGEEKGPKELEKLLSFATFDEHGCLEFNAFCRLNMICKSLCRPLEHLRQLLRRSWLGESFWRRCDRYRDQVEAEHIIPIGKQLREGYFSREVKVTKPSKPLLDEIDHIKLSP
jgi:hypothetical protein